MRAERVLQEIKMRFGGDLEDVTERLEVSPLGLWFSFRSRWL